MAQIEFRITFDDQSSEDMLFMKQLSRLSDMTGFIFEVKNNLIRKIEYAVETDPDANTIDLFQKELYDLVEMFDISDDIIQ